MTEQPVIDNERAGSAWAPLSYLARTVKAKSSWSVPVLGSSGLPGVITMFLQRTGVPQRDELDLVTLYAGYAASAIERDRLLSDLTARNRVLETIREVLETLAGSVSVPDGFAIALQALRRGLQADQVALLTQVPNAAPGCRAYATAGDRKGAGAPAALLGRLAGCWRSRAATTWPASLRWRAAVLAVTFAAPAGPTVLLVGWRSGPATADATALMEDAAHSLRLALEREEAGLAHQEATALRRSQELQRGFLSRLSHELRTPLTAIRGYASSLLQPDVTWDGDSQQRFLGARSPMNRRDSGAWSTTCWTSRRSSRASCGCTRTGATWPLSSRPPSLPARGRRPPWSR